MFEFFGNSDRKENDRGTALRLELESKEQWTTLMEASYDKPVYIFKHSSRCGISSMVLRRFEKQVASSEEHYYHLHIQAFRSLSNWIAEELKIRHESPQLIVIKEGKVLKHGSHNALLELLPLE